MVTKINNPGSCWAGGAAYRNAREGNATGQYPSIPDQREAER